jgi:dUTP pyrophosphatase
MPLYVVRVHQPYIDDQGCGDATLLVAACVADSRETAKKWGGEQEVKSEMCKLAEVEVTEVDLVWLDSPAPLSVAPPPPASVPASVPAPLYDAQAWGIPPLTGSRTLWIDYSTREIASLYTKELDPDDSGFDLYLPSSTTFPSMGFTKVGMGVKAKLTRGRDPKSPSEPFGLHARSSLYKHGLMLANSVGVFDRSYRGEVGAVFYNGTDKEVTVEKGTRLVQLCAADFQPFRFGTLSIDSGETARGAGGFGSSGEK